MNVSPEGRDLVAEFEQGPGGGPALKAYLCPAGVWTIGFGHAQGVNSTDTLPSKAAAEMLLDDELVEWADGVERAIAGAKTGQHEFDAMVSLAFNIGVPGFPPGEPKRMLRISASCHRAPTRRAVSPATLARIRGESLFQKGLIAATLWLRLTFVRISIGGDGYERTVRLREEHWPQVIP